LELDPELQAALADFRQNVNAWSDAVASRPRMAVRSVQALRWRLALGSALGCLLVAGSISAVVARYRGGEQAQKAPASHAAEPAARQLASAATGSVQNDEADAAARDLLAIERMLTSQEAVEEQESRVGSDEQLLVAVNTDLKRQIPQVMEPLAQLAEDSEQAAR
jgi:hypothetical protein